MEYACEYGFVEREGALSQVGADVLRCRVDVLVGAIEELLHGRVDGVERVAHDLLELCLQFGGGGALEEVLVPLERVVLLKANGLDLSGSIYNL